MYFQHVAKTESCVAREQDISSPSKIMIWIIVAVVDNNFMLLVVLLLSSLTPQSPSVLIS